MGIIVDANSDHDANDTYMLVSGGVVVDAIIASYNFCNNNILGSYDYLIDVTVGGQDAGPGYTYDSGTDTFTAPPEDFEAELESALYAVDAAVSGALDAYLAASIEDRATAISNVTGALSGENADQIAVMTALLTMLADNA